jgi:hypothetical protein
MVGWRCGARQKRCKSAPEAPPRLVRLAPYRSRVYSVLWSRCLRPGVMGDPSTRRSLCVYVRVCVGVPTSNQEFRLCLVIIKGTVSSLVWAFSRSPRPATLPGLASTKVALTTSLPVLLSSFRKPPPKPPNLPITWLSVFHLSPGYRRASSTHTAAHPTREEGYPPPEPSTVCRFVCVRLGITYKGLPNPRPLHRAAAAAPDNVSCSPFCCLQQRAPPAWFCPSPMFAPPKHIYAAHLQPISTSSNLSPGDSAYLTHNTQPASKHLLNITFQAYRRRAVSTLVVARFQSQIHLSLAPPDQQHLQHQLAALQ